MEPRQCPYCQQPFCPAKTHPLQLVCGRPECQRKRRTEYRRGKLTSDPAYTERCRESARQWRKQHPNYWREYREKHPETVAHNRERQDGRDRKQRLKLLANNTLAADLKPCPATVWLLGPGWSDLANNTLAQAQVWILQALPSRIPARAALANNTALAG